MLQLLVLSDANVLREVFGGEKHHYSEKLPGKKNKTSELFLFVSKDFNLFAARELHSSEVPNPSI